MRRDPGFTVIELIIVIGVLALVTTLLMPALVKTREKSTEPRCRTNLKQIALAAMQYADEKRFFPHRAKMSKLDGGFSTDTAARCMRALVYYNYDDKPESFVCPSSPDEWKPLEPAAK